MRSAIVNEEFVKRVVKLIAELAAVAIAVALLQLTINWVGFTSIWPLLVGVLVVLIIIIATMRK